MAQLRIATIGRSGIAERFVDALSQLNNAIFVGAYSRKLEDAKAFAEAHGASLAFDSIADLAASPDVDAVYIASPNAFHAKQALELVRAGKHVLVEKAFAPNPAWASAVFEEADKSGVIALEAMRNCFGPSLALLQEKLPELGEVRKATFRFSKVTSRIAKLKQGELVNIFDPRMAAGALMDIGIYTVSPAVALFGRPKAIKALGLCHELDIDGPDKTIDLAGEVLLDYEKFLVNLSYGKVSDDLLSSQIEGDEATLCWGDTSGPRWWSLVRHEGSEMIYSASKAELVPEAFDVPENDMVFEIDYFVRAALGDEAALAEVKRHREITLASQDVMAEIRKQLGVSFPQDGQDLM